MSQDVNTSQPGPGATAGTSHHFISGLVMALLALALLGWTFFIPSSTIPRLMAIVVGIFGIGAAAGFIPVRSPQDFFGGLVLVIVATVALIASADLPGQRGFAFGPGTAPRLFSGMLAAVSGAVAISGVFTNGQAIGAYRIRGPAYVIVSILMFAMFIRPLGLVISAFLAFILSIMGSTEMRWIESIIAGALMTLMCVLLFVYLLNLPFQLWPPDNALQLLGRELHDLISPFLPAVPK